MKLVGDYDIIDFTYYRKIKDIQSLIKPNLIHSGFEFKSVENAVHDSHYFKEGGGYSLYKAFPQPFCNAIPRLLHGLELNEGGKWVTRDIAREIADPETILNSRVQSPVDSDMVFLRKHNFATSVGFLADVDEYGIQTGDCVIVTLANEYFKNRLYSVDPGSNYYFGYLTTRMFKKPVMMTEQQLNLFGPKNDDKVDECFYGDDLIDLNKCRYRNNVIELERIKETGNFMIIPGEKINILKNNPYALPKFREEVLEFIVNGNPGSIRHYLNNTPSDITQNFGFLIGSLSAGIGLISIGSVDSEHPSHIGFGGGFDRGLFTFDKKEYQRPRDDLLLGVRKEIVKRCPEESIFEIINPPLDVILNKILTLAEPRILDDNLIREIEKLYDPKLKHWVYELIDETDKKTQ